MKGKKLFYVANARMPNEKAHGIQLAKMCEAFVEQGIDLELIIPRLGIGQEKSIKDYYGLRHDIRVRALPVINIAPSSALGFNIRSFSFAISSYFFLAFKYIITRQREAVCYTIDLDQFSFFTLPLSGYPVFLEVHGSKRRTIFTRIFFRLCDGVITNSRGTRLGILKTFEIENDRIISAPNGIDIDQFSNLPDKYSARRKLHLPQDKRIVLYVGRFYDWKGLDILTHAAAFVPGEVMFVLVGGDADNFHDATGMILPVTAKAVGGRSYVEIPLWLTAADTLLVLGTKKNQYSWLETSPMKLFEYMAMLRPVVASETPANKEIVSENEVFFYEPDNPKSLASAIALSILDAQAAKDKSETAYEKIKTYTWNKRAKNVLEFISDVE